MLCPAALTFLTHKCYFVVVLQPTAICLSCMHLCKCVLEVSFAAAVRIFPKNLQGFDVLSLDNVHAC